MLYEVFHKTLYLYIIYPVVGHPGLHPKTFCDADVLVLRFGSQTCCLGYQTTRGRAWGARVAGGAELRNEDPRVQPEIAFRIIRDEWTISNPWVFSFPACIQEDVVSSPNFTQFFTDAFDIFLRNGPPFFLTPHPFFLAPPIFFNPPDLFFWPLFFLTPHHLFIWPPTLFF